MYSVLFHVLPFTNKPFPAATAAEILQHLNLGNQFNVFHFLFSYFYMSLNFVWLKDERKASCYSLRPLSTPDIRRLGTYYTTIINSQDLWGAFMTSYNLLQFQHYLFGDYIRSQKLWKWAPLQAQPHLWALFSSKTFQSLSQVWLIC